MWTNSYIRRIISNVHTHSRQTYNRHTRTSNVDVDIDLYMRGDNKCIHLNIFCRGNLKSHLDCPSSGGCETGCRDLGGRGRLHRGNSSRTVITSCLFLFKSYLLQPTEFTYSFISVTATYLDYRTYTGCSYSNCSIIKFILWHKVTFNF
jgi:hypothetical protein